MKRKSLLFLLLMAMFAPLAMNGQTPLLNENFDSMSSISTSYSATGWYAYNAGNGKNWTLNTDGSYSNSGSKSAQVQFDSSNPANCYLISKPFSVSSDMAELSVSLYEAVRSSNYAETFEVFFVKASDVTTLAGVASATHYGVVASASYTNTSYAQVSGSVTSSALAGQSVRVVVHCTSAANMWYLYIDDITVTETVPVSCDPYTLPYTEGFEGDGINCWTGGSMNTANSIGLTNEIAHGGTYAFVFSSYNSASNFNQYLISPELNTNDAINVSFYYTRPSSYGDESFRVGYSTTTNDISAFTWEYDIANTTVTDWTLFEGIMPAGTKYVAINYYSDYQYYLVVDDFSFTVSACAAPTDLTAEITGNAAELSWTGTQENYNVRYRKGFVYDFESAEPWTITDFSPCTVYDGDQTRGYSFENETFTNIPFTGSTIAFQSQVGNLSSHSGNAFGMMISAIPSQYPDGITHSDDWFILPEITIANGDVFSFWGREITTQYGDETINVGIYGNTAGTFTATIASNVAVNSTEWTEFSYDLSAYAGQTIKLAINYVSNDIFGFMFDDIFVGNPNWSNPISVTGNTYTLEGLGMTTDYQWKVQGVNTECTGGTTDWSALATFTTPEGYVKHITGYTNNGGYYLIASPIGTVDPEEVTNMITPNDGNNRTYDLYRFQQNPSDGLEWRNYRQEAFDLNIGQGYLYAHRTDVDLVFTGSAISGPTYNVPLTKSASASGHEFPDWNLVGNPFADIAHIDGGHAFYTLDVSGAYTLVSDASSTIESMQGVFVVAGENEESITFVKGEPSKKSPKVTLNVSKGTESGVIDRAIVCFGETRQMPKFQLFKNSTKVYIPMETSTARTSASPTCT